MALGFVIRKNAYHDSVFLMRITQTLNDEPGVVQAAALMATETNKKLLTDIGISGSALAQAGPNDLVVAVQAVEPGMVERLLANLDHRMQSLSRVTKRSSYSSLEEAAISNPEANLVVISIPGEYAAREARQALEQGKHVFLFSNNVALEQEIELKQFAQSRGLLVMGPDCGTSIINGTGIGFANVVRHGPVGVIGASGTGLQEFTSLVHQAGSGISHAIGTGSRDLSNAVGGVTTLMGFNLLEADPETQVIAIVSKPVQPETLERLMERVARSRKPVIGCFLGLDYPIAVECSNFTQSHNLDEAVQLAIGQATHNLSPLLPQELDIDSLIKRETSAWSPQQRYLRGLFAGGTFCYQSQQILTEACLTVYSNAPLDQRYLLEKPEASIAHTLIDMGDDLYTRSKPHPMIDAGMRRQRIMDEAADPEVAILLLDFILGYIASNDPVGDLIGAIAQAKAKTANRGGHLTVVASLCGTDRDPQDYYRQKQMLEEAGVLVFPSNLKAALFCARLLCS